MLLLCLTQFVLLELIENTRQLSEQAARGVLGEAHRMTGWNTVPNCGALERNVELLTKRAVYDVRVKSGV